jgi:cell division transport system permease protein
MINMRPLINDGFTATLAVEMAKTRDKMAKRRMRGSYMTTVIGIALVLFMMGCLGLILLNAKKIESHVKENIRFQVYLKHTAKDVAISKLQKNIDASSYAKSAQYISKAEGAAQLREELDEDFIAFNDGVNPLPALISVNLNAAYAHPDSIQQIVTGLETEESVDEVVYPKDMIAKMEANMGRITIFMLAFSAILLLIAIALINNTIRLAMYSKRFIIRSMQLVGATRGFIQRPFLWQGIVQGVLGGVLAMGLLAGFVFLLRKEIPPSFEFQDLALFGKLFGLTVVLGIVIAFVSTFFAVNRYIRMKLDDLY